MCKLLMVLVALIAPVMGGCECEEAPDTYQGAARNGGYSGYGYNCATYANRDCDYTLCQRYECGGWRLESWYCY